MRIGIHTTSNPTYIMSANAGRHQQQVSALFLFLSLSLSLFAIESSSLFLSPRGVVAGGALFCVCDGEMVWCTRVRTRSGRVFTIRGEEVFDAEEVSNHHHHRRRHRHLLLSSVHDVASNTRSPITTTNTKKTTTNDNNNNNNNNNRRNTTTPRGPDVR